MGKMCMQCFFFFHFSVDTMFFHWRTSFSESKKSLTLKQNLSYSVRQTMKIIINILTNFSGQGKSNNLTIPKSSPVTMLRPEWDTQAQMTSALSVLRDQIPTTSSPRTLNTNKKYLVCFSKRVMMVYVTSRDPHLVQVAQVILSI